MSERFFVENWYKVPFNEVSRRSATATYRDGKGKTFWRQCRYMKETEKLLRKTANQLSQKHISWVERRNDNYIVLYKHIYSCKCMLFLVKNLFPTWHFNFLESSTRWKANQPVKLFWHTRWVLKKKKSDFTIFLGKS